MALVGRPGGPSVYAAGGAVVVGAFEEVDDVSCAYLLGLPDDAAAEHGVVEDLLVNLGHLRGEPEVALAGSGPGAAGYHESLRAGRVLPHEPVDALGVE